MTISYRGITIPYAKHSDETTDRTVKEIAFPGVDGTYEMHMGKRQRTFRIEGLIVDIVTGSFTKTTVEGWNDTGVGSLVIHGTTYSNVRMVKCTFDQAYKNAVTGKITCTFTIEFAKIQ